jgi:hypothetical protein
MAEVLIEQRFVPIRDKCGQRAMSAALVAAIE